MYGGQITALVLSVACFLHEAKASEVSFRNDVMAVLSKAGCNAGACHGNANGKAGFKLSLRGDDPDFDFKALTRDQFGRRINPLEPEQSLILLKPTTQLAHEGGKRFSKDSWEFETFRGWIADGAREDAADTRRLEKIEATPTEKILVEPADSVQLQVRATFSDGSQRDISRKAVYETANSLAKVTPEGLVRRESMGETTVLVRYLHKQVPVRLAFVPTRPGFQWKNVPANNYVDEQVFAKLRTLRMNPSALCSDDVFLRRAYLDLLGILPTAEEARAFVAEGAMRSAPLSAPSTMTSQRGRGRKAATFSKSEIRNQKSEMAQSLSRLAGSAVTEVVWKRARLIDQLLERPEFADFWALKWSDLLRVEERALDQKGMQSFYHWIRQSLAEKKPMDQFVRELIAARGSTYLNPAANFYRANRDAITRAEAAAQVFLGTQLRCAQCHNHPFDRWTQDDYYNWAAVFSKVQYKVLENRRTDSNDSHEFKGEQIVYLARKGEVKNPRTAKPAEPHFLGDTNLVGARTPRPRVDGEQAEVAKLIIGEINSPDRSESMNSRTRRPRSFNAVDQSASGSDELDGLAAWLTSPDNSLFARVQVNRIWYHLMGRGIVDPIEDFRATNPASHPALLDALAQDFVTHKFDLRHIIRTIMNSRAYQLSSEPNETNRDDDLNYSHALVRRLTAEQLLDCQSQVTGVPNAFSGYPIGLRAAQMPGAHAERKRGKANPLDQFLELFGKPQRLLTCECERSSETTMGQAFQMISGPSVNDLLTKPDNRLTRLLAAGKPSHEMIEALYWTALTREPSAGELEKARNHLEKNKDRRAALEDLTWGLLNAKEFLLRR